MIVTIPKDACFVDRQLTKAKIIVCCKNLVAMSKCSALEFSKIPHGFWDEDKKVFTGRHLHRRHPDCPLKDEELVIFIHDFRTEDVK